MASFSASVAPCRPTRVHQAVGVQLSCRSRAWPRPSRRSSVRAARAPARADRRRRSRRDGASCRCWRRWYCSASMISRVGELEQARRGPRSASRARRAPTASTRTRCRSRRRRRRSSSAAGRQHQQLVGGEDLSPSNGTCAGRAGAVPAARQEQSAAIVSVACRPSTSTVCGSTRTGGAVHELDAVVRQLLAHDLDLGRGSPAGSTRLQRRELAAGGRAKSCRCRRRACASASTFSTASRSAFEGIVPVLIATPPTGSVCSTTHTRLPSLAAWIALFCPPGPLPMTHRSKCRMAGIQPQWATEEHRAVRRELCGPLWLKGACDRRCGGSSWRRW